MPKDWLAIFMVMVTVRARVIKIRTVSIISTELLILSQTQLSLIVHHHEPEKTELLCSRSRFKTSLTNKTGLLYSSGFKTSAFFFFYFFFLCIDFSAAKLSVLMYGE